jgi:hypothetical protein
MPVIGSGPESPQELMRFLAQMLILLRNGAPNARGVRPEMNGPAKESQRITRCRGGLTEAVAPAATG